MNTEHPLILEKGSYGKIWLPVPIYKPFEYRLHQSMPLGAIVEVPFGARKLRGVLWSRGSGQAHISIKSTLAQFDIPPMRADFMRFLDRMADYTITPLGQILPMAIRVDPYIPEKSHLALIDPSAEPMRPLPPKQAALMKFLQSGAVARNDLDFSRSVIQGLIDKNLAQWQSAPRIHHEIQVDYERLSQAQRSALSEIIAENKPSLLHGVTGSGKTEIYLELVADTIKNHKQALIMLPEIALTERFIERFEKRFGFEPAYWHSQMTKSLRQKTWHNIASGDTPLVIGARSALFLPFRNLGVIVVDEEHDSGFKQSDQVIYNGRDMAVLRGYFEKAKIVLASATPSVESMVNAELGKYHHIKISERFGAAKLPKIEMIDMKSEALDVNHWVSQSLIDAIKDKLSQNEQSLLFLNRRGFAPLTLCRACGHQLECKLCDARLVEHRARNRLACHQCGYEQNIPKACPNCKVEGKLAPIGPGVERIAEEIAQAFPHAKIEVISSDNFDDAHALSQTLTQIENGEIDIIIGTQMIAKGHNFPNMTLIGVIDADSGLQGTDLRSAESSFQIIQQVTGRAGRAERPGIALIQSYQPEHPILQAIIAQDSEHFYQEEIARRAKAQVPPYTRYISLTISAFDLEDAMNYAKTLLKNSEILHQNDIRILGPALAPIAKIRNRMRVKILLQLPKNSKLHSIVQSWLEAEKIPSKVRLQIDVDPLSFL